MPLDLINIITTDDESLRSRAIEAACRGHTAEQLLEQCGRLDSFRRQSDNLYHRVRALFFLYAIHRFHLPAVLPADSRGHISYDGYGHLLQRRFEEAIDVFLAAQGQWGPSDALSSALAQAYRDLAFATLASQVRRSVRGVRGNQWVFRMGHPADQPLRLRSELLGRGSDGTYPILAEKTPVRMDLTHSAWSDIFFLGMDYPRGARVLNVSIDLAVRGRDAQPKPPVEAYLRVIDQPIIRLVSVDLGAKAEVATLDEMFDFARDYLGLLKAAVIASGLVPAGLEGSAQHLSDLLSVMIGPGLGLEIVSSVNNIPKGSRLAVSTNLLASLIALCMRATGQAASMTGQLTESERRLVAARAILGEWIGGSGGGWQDSGGVWPGMKLIEGAEARPGDPEFGISRGRLLPNHRILDRNDVSDATRARLRDSLVLVHGGMAQNVGPILEMVTEKYLLRSGPEWAGRQEAMKVLDRILGALKAGDVREVAAATTHNFFHPIQAIIPAASNLFTETLIERTKARFGLDFWGFWMLGGMSGGGMGFIVAPQVKAAAQDFLQQMMRDTKRELETALPFAMEPVVYDFAINEMGTDAALLGGGEAMMPPGYYALMVPAWLRAEARSLTPLARIELERFGATVRGGDTMPGMVNTLFDRLIPKGVREQTGDRNLASLLGDMGFDREQHEQIRAALRAGRIGLAQNRLPASTRIEDVREGDLVDARLPLDPVCQTLGRKALESGAVAMVSLAAGAGSRWTQGAGVVKALHPFVKMAGRHRGFLEVHVAKSRRTGERFGTPPAHLVTTSYLTHAPIESHLKRQGNYGYTGPLHLSPGRAVGLRMIPMERDLRFAWEEVSHQRLDEQKQKMRESLHAALIGWARSAGEGGDYTDNLPAQCLHPVGHWYEIPNLLRNGVLLALLKERPSLRYLMLHNIDTLGADLDPSLIGLHIQRGWTLSFEVIPRRLEDRGGGLARVDGRPRLVEGLAMPREEDEFALSYYNTLTTWIDIEGLLKAFSLTRSRLSDEQAVAKAIRAFAAAIPTYVTLKDVKKRWGHGQEDVYPVAQFEKLWGDMSALSDVPTGFIVVPRARGQQLKDQAQLDGWLRDGSAKYVESLCAWDK
jgi:hypothetical protein